MLRFWLAALVLGSFLIHACSDTHPPSPGGKRILANPETVQAVTEESAPPCMVPSYSGTVRESVLAGTWYPADAEALQRDVDACLEQATLAEESVFPVRALISPHAGYRYSGPTAGYAYKTVMGKNYKRVIVLAPSHSQDFRGGSIAEVIAYRTPLGDVPLDREACDELLVNDTFTSLPEAHATEHSLEIQLPFLQRALGNFRLIPIVVSRLSILDARAMADRLRPLLDGDTLLVMSSDFTHQGERFGYVPFRQDVRRNIQRLDFAAVNHILNLDAWGLRAFCDATRATLCGRAPIELGLMALPAQVQADFLHYETSGDSTRDYTETVSYAAIAFREREDYLNRDEEATLFKLARTSLEEAFSNPASECPVLEADRITERMQAPKGVFVTLKKKGELRGCIGQLQSVEPLYKTVAQTVRLSAFQDRRFPPLLVEEMSDIDIEISVMSPMKKVSSWRAIVLGRDGMVLRKGGAMALFLPQVALEQGWSIEETLSHLSVKAGLSEDDWKEDCEFETFTAQVFGEQNLWLR